MVLLVVTINCDLLDYSHRVLFFPVCVKRIRISLFKKVFQYKVFDKYLSTDGLQIKIYYIVPNRIC